MKHTEQAELSASIRLAEDIKQSASARHVCASRTSMLCGQRYLKGARTAMADVHRRSNRVVINSLVFRRIPRSCCAYQK